MSTVTRDAYAPYAKQFLTETNADCAFVFVFDGIHGTSASSEHIRASEVSSSRKHLATTMRAIATSLGSPADTFVSPHLRQIPAYAQALREGTDAKAAFVIVLRNATREAVWSLAYEPNSELLVLSRMQSTLLESAFDIESLVAQEQYK